MDGDTGLDLTVQVPADEWGYSQRRIQFLEAMLYRVLRDDGAIQEWFSAAQLASVQLHGLSTSPGAITRKANKEGWRRKVFQTDAGTRYLYHITALPKKAFDSLLERLLDLPEGDEVGEDWVSDITPETVPEPAPDNTAPPWVLPLMRLMKGEANGNLAHAWRELPGHLPIGTQLPSVEEAAEILVRFGIAKE